MQRMGTNQAQNIERSVTATVRQAGEEISFTVLGSPQSKANSRKAVMLGKRPAFIKSDAARAYLANFQLQCPRLKTIITTPVAVFIEIFYSSRRPDLDESLILDAMQDRIYANDRQVQEKHILWGLDQANPRCVVRIVPIQDRAGASHPGNKGLGRTRPKDQGSKRSVA